MGLSGDQVFYLFLAVIAGLSISVWVFIEHLGVRTKARAKVQQIQAREETRREIAAYVAEGSISADDAAKLMAMGPDSLEGVKAGLREMLAKSAESVRAKVSESSRAGCC
jgi:glutamate synthase domain-containing protein 2